MKTMIRAMLAMLFGASLLLCAPAVKAAEADKGEAAKPEAAEPEASKSKQPEAEDQAGEPTDAAGETTGAARLKDLVGDGFVIRTTVFIPADAVTRQLGKVSGDAVVLTLQKSTSTAVCYYTFKAYVAEGLTDIPSCVVHR
jgi:hypothetical protein